jgi:SAM-dependent methyltransferase
MVACQNGDVSGKIYSNDGNGPLLAAVPSGRALRVLDLGCGAGDNARILRHAGHIVDGITLSEGEAAEAKRYCRAVFVHDLEGDLPQLPEDSYDVCLASHVLEHLRWPEKLLAAVTPLLAAREGILLVALPNIMNYRYRWPLFCGRFEYAASGVMDASHFRWFTFASGRRLLEGHGFFVERAWAEGGFPLWKLRRVLPRRATGWLDRVACTVLPGLFGHQLLYVARVCS